MINEVVGPDSINIHHLYSKYEKSYLNDTLWLENGSGFYIAVFDENWVFFIDMMPVANWAHDCKIVFMDISSGNYTIYDEMMPPYPFFSNINEFFTEWEWILSVGLNNQIKNDKEYFIIAPNPFSNKIVIKCNNLSNKSITIKIFNNVGKQVLTTNHYTSSTSNGILSINTKKLKPGIFYVQIIINNSVVYREKIIKARK